MATFIIKDKWSAITHFIGFIFSILATPFIVSKASYDNATFISMISISVFMLSMTLLYGASTAYHSFNITKIGNSILKRIDHCSIFVLIAGSYTPVCIVGLHNLTGYILLIVVWALAIIGIIIKIFFVYCPKWVSSLMYLALGWAVIFTIKDIYLAFTIKEFVWLTLGGFFYTVGGVLYAIKPKIFKKEEITGFGNHELFHVFVMLGTLSHYILCLNLI